MTEIHITMGSNPISSTNGDVEQLVAHWSADLAQNGVLDHPELKTSVS